MPSPLDRPRPFHDCRIQWWLVEGYWLTLFLSANALLEQSVRLHTQYYQLWQLTRRSTKPFQFIWWSLVTYTSLTFFRFLYGHQMAHKYEHKYEHLWVNVGQNRIWESPSEKLLGVIIDSKLKLDKHAESILKSAGRKLSALAGMSNVLTFLKLRMLMKSFFESQFSYCPLVWMFCSRTLNPFMPEEFSKMKWNFRKKI